MVWTSRPSDTVWTSSPSRGWKTSVVSSTRASDKSIERKLSAAVLSLPQMLEINTTPPETRRFVWQMFVRADAGRSGELPAGKHWSVRVTRIGGMSFNFTHEHNIRHVDQYFLSIVHIPSDIKKFPADSQGTDNLPDKWWLVWKVDVVSLKWDWKGHHDLPCLLLDIHF